MKKLPITIATETFMVWSALALLLAGAIAYNALLSLVPLLILSVIVLSKLLSPSELMDEAVWLIRRDEGFASAVNRPLSKADPTIDALVPDVPVLAAMYAQFEDLNRELKATRGAPDLLRAQLKRLRGQGWLEVRLQPKALGAKEGDVIETYELVEKERV